MFLSLDKRWGGKKKQSLDLKGGQVTVGIKKEIFKKRSWSEKYNLDILKLRAKAFQAVLMS